MPHEKGTTVAMYITYPEDIYRCFALDELLEFAKFRNVKGTKRK